jgi:hypothetical protein
MQYPPPMRIAIVRVKPKRRKKRGQGLRTETQAADVDLQDAVTAAS